MRNVFIIFCLLFVVEYVNCQNPIHWDGKYLLKLSDFKSSATQIGDVSIYSLYTSSGIDFLFQMTNAEFMFTKNFNSKVGCSFQPSSSALVAPDTATALDLLNFARYQFDLSELYARKFRKKLYEEKGAFSNANFFRPVYDSVMKDFTERNTKASKETDLGRNGVKLKELHSEVLNEMQGYADFCKSCKPQKR